MRCYAILYWTLLYGTTLYNTRLQKHILFHKMRHDMNIIYNYMTTIWQRLILQCVAYSQYGKLELNIDKIKYVMLSFLLVKVT